MNSRTTKILSWLIALAGLWMFISPWVLGYTAITSAFVDALIVGALLVIFGVVAALTNSSGTARGLNWLNAILGLWLIVSPFVLAFAALHSGAEDNFITVGIIELVLGVIAALAARSSVRQMEDRTHMGTVPVTGDNSMRDNNIRNSIVDRLTQDPNVDNTGIDVHVHNGDVTLKGTVHSNTERQQAEADAQGIDGVRNVNDDLKVM